MFEILGIAGIAISVAAYVPQIVHLGREHCSAGVSNRAWAMWLASGLLVGLLAVHRRDPVFIILQLSSLTSAAVILFLARRYRGMACETHAHLVPRRRLATATPGPDPSRSQTGTAALSSASLAGPAHERRERMM
ncbi:MAG: PQ-loop domain-containing transporter [Actinomycetota bacterium]